MQTRQYLQPKRKLGSGERFTMISFIVCTVHLIVEMIKSIKLRLAWQVVRMEEGRGTFKI